jgi:hypothetical protein
VSGISARIGTLAIAKQSAKGTPAGAPTSKYYMSAADSLGPNKERGRLSRTDGGRDVGPGFTSQMSAGGDATIYAHPSALALPIAAAAGANADSGSTPNYIHTITPANDGMWVTIWRMLGNVVLERFDDCKITSITINGQAGQPLQVTLSFIGIKSTFLASDPVLSVVNDAPYLYPEAVGAITIDAVAYPIPSVSFGINNNFSGFQADDYYFSDIDPGGRDVTLSLAARFTGPTAFPEYRQFYYGSAGGTAQSPAVGTHAFDVTWTRNVNTSLKITLPQVTYNAIPVHADPGGDPIGVDLACAVEPPTAGGNIFTVVVKDQNVTIS